MANGSTHFKANLITSSGLLIGSFMFMDPGVSICSVSGSVLATFYTPDIDDPGKNYFENLLKELVGNFLHRALGVNKVYAFEVGKFLQKVYMMLTMPYAMFVPHRSWLSHFPILGTLGRFFYLDMLLTIILLLLGGGTSITFWGSAFAAGTSLFSGSGSVLTFDSFYLYALPIRCSLSFITSWAVNDLSHTPILDGGMYIYARKKRYLFGKGFYELSRRIFSGKK